VDTEQLMSQALASLAHLDNQADGKEQQIATAQAYALLAIANELKKINDRADAEAYSRDLLEGHEL
jgi:hypothetical protein